MSSGLLQAVDAAGNFGNSIFQVVNGLLAGASANVSAL
jgi:hypothetical protein